ncbi:MAG: SH3 domain-containing protein, partial [Lewinellaceae bacterium]|nr:SH3 domain-containing protein [Lewinellaceae bacterium]
VTINGLKMRKEPNLKSGVVTRLKLDEEVFFLNEKSEKRDTINLGYETVAEYWVKVRTKSGKDGWVFGAGVHYFKMKRKGVME